MPSNRLAPFLSRDFTLLYLVNICEFFASTLSRLCALQWLYEATGDAVALGLVGLVTLTCQLPSIALGGVLADALPRAPLVANVQSVAALVAVLRWLLCAAGALSPAIIYLTIGLLECTKYLEGSARDVILPHVVSSDSLPHAVSIVMITQYAAEIAAPFVFWALADAGGVLTLAFFTAAVGFAACAVLPRLIRADTTPKSDEQSGDGGLKRAGRDAAESVEMLGPRSDVSTGPAGALMTTPAAAASLTSRREHPLLSSLLWLSRAWRSALVKMLEGVRYILSHPLLPGLYALDWGFTCVSYYRELFPMWVGVWLTHGVPVGLSSRGVVALLVVANFSGGLAGALGTLALNAYPYKGRLVLYATAGYGVACFLFGCSPLLMSGVITIFLMGAFDAVGATMRKQVVLLSTPDHLRGRAQSGHQFAANVANSLGQIYVALMVAQVGAGLTMQLGGLVTETMTCFFGWTIPSLLTFSTLVGAKHVDATRPMGTANEAAQEDERHAERLPQLVSNAGAERHDTRYPEDWQVLNDAARAARDLEEGERALAQAADAARAAGPQRE